MVGSGILSSLRGVSGKAERQEMVDMVVRSDMDERAEAVVYAEEPSLDVEAIDSGRASSEAMDGARLRDEALEAE
jgi:hypothetical protein